MAASNILSGSLFAETQVTITWAADLTPTLKSLEEVVGLQATRNIQSGQSIRPTYVRKPVMVEQVVARSDLGALRPLTDADLEVAKGAPQTGTFTSVQQLAGMVLLQAAPRGSVLRAEQLINSAELQGRAIIAISVKGSSGPILKVPTKVELLFVARSSNTNQAVDSTDNLMTPMKDVLVLQVIPVGDPTALVVAILERDIERLNRLLGIADIYIVRRFP